MPIFCLVRYWNKESFSLISPVHRRGWRMGNPRGTPLPFTGCFAVSCEPFFARWRHS